MKKIIFASLSDDPRNDDIPFYTSSPRFRRPKVIGQLVSQLILIWGPVFCQRKSRRLLWGWEIRKKKVISVGQTKCLPKQIIWRRRKKNTRLVYVWVYCLAMGWSTVQWADKMVLYTSELIVLLLSPVTLSMKASEPALVGTVMRKLSVFSGTVTSLLHLVV